jgi:hypothetical protein
LDLSPFYLTKYIAWGEIHTHAFPFQLAEFFGPGVYSDRVAGRYRHHRDSGGDAFAGAGAVKVEGATDFVFE